MQVSINWLKQYVDIKSDIHTLTHQLSMMGLEVDSYHETEDGDYWVEIDLTPNRGDCLGIINLAREVAIIEGTKVRLPEYTLQSESEQTRDLLDIEVREPELCPRYAARIIKNVEIKASPEWLKKAVESVGIRSINNVVDITNFVMLENNQPLHAFDYNLLKGAKIIVRRAHDQEQFTTLDGMTRTLQATDLVISDGQEAAVALAGIMGGANTEINESTNTILLEAACFEGINVRKTSKRLGLRTDSSVRFEKNIDINAVTYALDRAAALIQEVAGGQVLADAVDVYPVPKEPVKVAFSTHTSNKLLGIALSADEIENIFNQLGFTCTRRDDDLFEVTVPTYRPDITMEVDLIEEVGKVYGYENIPTKLPEGVATIGGLNAKQKFKNQIKDNLSMHMLETINYSFISPNEIKFLETTPNAVTPALINIANPLSEEQSVMRTTLLPGLLQLVNNNVARQNSDLLFFEMGAVYLLDENGQIEEPWRVAGITSGKTVSNWVNKPVDMDFFYMKGILESLFVELDIKAEYVPTSRDAYHPGRAADILVDDRIVGVLGEIHPQVKQKFSLKGNVCAFEIDLELLFESFNPDKSLQSISKYPAIARDIAVVIDDALLVGEMLTAIKQMAPDFLKDMDVFDVYTGKPVPEGKKSVALNFLWQADDHTLKDEEVNSQMEAILKLLQANYHAQLRE